MTRWSGEHTDVPRGGTVKGQETSNSHEEIGSYWDSSEIIEREVDLYTPARWGRSRH